MVTEDKQIKEDEEIYLDVIISYLTKAQATFDKHKWVRCVLKAKKLLDKLVSGKPF